MRTLLFVGDEDILRELPGLQDASGDFRMILASTGRRAFHMMEREAPDVVVLFVESVIDGRAAFVSVLAEERDIPVVLCTTTCTCLGQVHGWPADAVLVAPGEFGELILAIQAVLERKTAVPVPALGAL